jgi:hypothetical protein
MPEPNSNTRWLTLQDLARVTGFSVSFLRTEIKRGALQGHAHQVALAATHPRPLAHRRDGRGRLAPPDWLRDEPGAGRQRRRVGGV